MPDVQSPLSFTKMQGAGNDFVVINNREGVHSEQELIAWTPVLCDRKFGIGADGLLALCPSQSAQTDYHMLYRNADGSDAGMCGNGARCLALFAHQNGFKEQQTFSVHDKIYQADILNAGSVRISFPVETNIEQCTIDDRNLWVLHTGTEHVVTEVPEERLTQVDWLTEEGQKYRYHPEFQPEGTNVNFISGVSETEVKLQTYERGVENLTLACGTGAIASALVWHHQKGTTAFHQPYRVVTEGGTLLVYFVFDSETQTYSNLKLEGPAHVVFEGTYHP